VSNLATVTVALTANPTTITFAPAMTARRPATLSLEHVGDTSVGNTALPIFTAITIRGPAGPNRITLAGPGSDSDLRAFLVTASGELAVEYLTLRNWSSDSKGGAIYNLGTATLTDCILTDNSAGSQGGAIWNFGSLTLTRSMLSRNHASEGGGLFNHFG